MIKLKEDKKPKGKKELVYSFSYNIISKIVTYFLVLVLGNLYIVTEYGKSLFVLSVYNILAVTAVIGIPNAIIPWIINKKDYKSVFRALLSFSAVLAVTTLIVSYSVIHVKNYDPRLVYSMALISLSIVLYCINNISASFLISKKRYDLVNLFGLLSISLIFVFAIFFRKSGSLGIIFAYFLGFLFSASVMSFSVRKSLSDLLESWDINFKNLWEYLRGGFFVFLTSLSFFFLGWADSTILGLLSNLENVGKYGISSAFANIIILIPSTLSFFVITRLSEVKNKLKSQNILKRVIRISYSFSLLSSILIVSFLPIILKVFLPKYIGTSVFTSILLIGVVFYSSYFLVYNYFIAKLGIRKVLIPILLACIINIVFDIILIPSLGLYGICIATSSAHLIAFLLLSGKIFKSKEIILMAFLPLLLIVSFYLSYFGIFVALITLFLLFKLELLKKEDVNIITEEISNILKLN